MAHLYEADAYDTSRWPDSHWRASATAAPACPPLTGERRAEVAIIGAGYAGLNAALELAEGAGIESVVLDAGQPGWGASGRNGGFACRGGSKLSAAQITARFGAEAAAEWQRYELAAIERVRDNLARYDIDAEAGPEGELCLAHSPRVWTRMKRDAAPDVELLEPAALAERGFSGSGFHGGVLGRHGFPLHPMKYVLGLARAAGAAGVTVHGDSAVVSMRREGGEWRLEIARGGSVRAKRVLVATNGYSDEALPPWLGGRIFPVLSSILTTRPLSADELQAQGWTSRVMAYDSRRVLHYFRLLPCGRFLFGGRGGVSARASALAAFHTTLRAEFEALFPALAGAATEHYWSGFVCMTGSWAPFCAEVPDQPGLYAALGWHGNGVAAASEGGRRIAQALAGRPNPAPALVQAPLRRFPLPALRRPLKGLAVGVAKLLDGPVR